MAQWRPQNTSQAVVDASLRLKDSPKFALQRDVPAASLAVAVGDGIITIEEGMAAGSLLQTFMDTYETAHRLAKSLPLGNDVSP